jgi:hypothetical protein
LTYSKLAELGSAGLAASWLLACCCPAIDLLQICCVLDFWSDHVGDNSDKENREGCRSRENGTLRLARFSMHSNASKYLYEQAESVTLLDFT